MKEKYSELLLRLVDVLRSETEKHPEYADRQNRLGLALFLAKDYDAAEKHFRKAVSINSNYAECRANLAYLLHRTKRTEDAIKMLKKHLGEAVPPRVAHTRPFVTHTLGRLLALAGRQKEAKEFLAEAAKTKRPLLFRLDVELLRLLSDTATSRAKKRISHFASIDASYRRYISAHRLLTHESAIKRRIRRLFAVNPNLHLIYIDMADMVASDGDLKTANRLFMKAETILPDSAFAENALGTIHLARGELQKARGHFRRAIRYDPRFVKAYLNLAYICSDRGNIDSAIRHLQRAVKAAPLYPDIRWHLGTLLLLAGRYKEAKEELEKSLTLQPPYNVAKYALATALFHLNEFERVLALYDELNINGLELPDMHAQRVACYLALERPIDALRECIWILPSDNRPAFILYFAQALAHIGEEEQAADMLEKLLKTDSPDVIARRARNLLRRLKK